MKSLGKLAGIKQEEIDKAICALPGNRKRNAPLAMIEDGSVTDHESVEAPSGTQIVVRDAGEDAESMLPKPVYKRTKTDSTTLSDIIKVVEFALQLAPNRPRQKICRQKFPSILKSNILAKWIAKYMKFHLWKMPKELADKCISVPKVWIEQMKLEVPARGRNTICGMPIKVAEMLGAAQEECAMGLSKATKRSDAGQGPQYLKRSAAKAMAAYNAESQRVSEEIDQENAKAWNEFTSKLGEGKEVSVKKAASFVRELNARLKSKPKIYPKFKPSKMTATRLNRYLGFFRCRTNTAGNYLAFDDPRMVASRLHHQATLKEQSIKTSLVLSLGLVQ